MRTKNPPKKARGNTWFNPPKVAYKTPSKVAMQVANPKTKKPNLAENKVIYARLARFGQPVMVHGVRTLYFTIHDVAKVLGIGYNVILVTYSKGHYPEPYDYIIKNIKGKEPIAVPIYLSCQVVAIARVYGYFYERGYQYVRLSNNPAFVELMAKGAQAGLEVFFRKVENLAAQSVT